MPLNTRQRFRVGSAHKADALSIAPNKKKPGPKARLPNREGLSRERRKTQIVTLGGALESGSETPLHSVYAGDDPTGRVLLPDWIVDARSAEDELHLLEQPTLACVLSRAQEHVPILGSGHTERVWERRGLRTCLLCTERV